MPTTVLFTHRVATTLQSYYQSQLGKSFRLLFPNDLSDSALMEYASEIDILVAYKLNSEFLEKATRLKHIQVPWTGSETLDFELLRKFPAITVSNSHSNSLAIAEHAVSLFLAATKRITYSDSLMKKGDWSSRYDKENALWITGKVLGILGFGAIGKHVARIMSTGFKNRIWAIKRSLDRTNPEVEFIGTLADLNYVLENSDLILISMPLTKETNGLIRREHFEIMKKNAVLVNISRGAIIEEEALFNALKTRQIAAAGVDTWYNYPKDRKTPFNVYQNFPFHELSNCVSTPHQAFKVTEREEVFSSDIIENLKLIAMQQQPINQININLGY